MRAAVPPPPPRPLRMRAAPLSAPERLRRPDRRGGGKGGRGAAGASPPAPGAGWGWGGGGTRYRAAAAPRRRLPGRARTGRGPAPSSAFVGPPSAGRRAVTGCRWRARGSRAVPLTGRRGWGGAGGGGRGGGPPAVGTGSGGSGGPAGSCRCPKELPCESASGGFGVRLVVCSRAWRLFGGV